MDKSVEAELHPTLCKLLRPHISVKSVVSLTGGLSNHCVKITDEKGRHFVWRPFSVACEAFCVSRKDEFDSIQCAAQAGLTEPPYLLLPEGLLTHWVAGVTVEQASQNDVITLLARVHSLPVPGYQIDLFSRAEHYWSHLDPVHRSPLLASIHSHFQESSYNTGLEPVFCHFDFGLYNLIRSPEGKLQVIDWEYAAKGDPALDLVLCCQASGFDTQSAVEQYCKVRSIKDVGRWQEACRTWSKYADYLALMWFQLGFQIYGLDSYSRTAEGLMRNLRVRSQLP